MMIYTAKLNKKKLFGTLVIIILVVLAIILGLPKGNEDMTTMKNVKLSNEGEILGFIKELGYEVKENSMKNKEIILPKKFDEVYKKYNELQKEYGFNLEKYRGKKVMLYTFEILNHPESKDTILEIMIYKDKPIGGSIYTKNLDGFMYGLEKAK